MSDDHDLDPLPGLPPELEDLDGELRGFRVEERPSFAPELRAELERRWVQGGWARGGAWTSRAPLRRQGMAAAAAVTTLLLGALAVPPARASLAEMSRQSLRLLTGGGGGTDATAERPSGTAPLGAPPLGLVPPEPAAPEPSGPERGPEERSATLGGGSTGHGFGSDVPTPFRPPIVTFPELLDREANGAAIRKYYPEALQRAGVGGTATVRLWVESTGSVGDVQIVRGTGRSELDRAAILAARELRWVPATRGLVPTGTWVEFHLIFDPEVASPGPPEPPEVDEPVLTGDLASELPPAWSGESVVPSPIGAEARELLATALQWTPALAGRLGSLESLLEGAPGDGVSPLTWRADATTALQRATARDPDNPAPYLALARIRQKQGLHGEARGLLEKGVERARRGARPASAALVAELYYELGLLLRDESLAWRDLGTVDPGLLDASRCPGARVPTGQEEDHADLLVGWNYVCPEELERAFVEGFRNVRPPPDAGRATAAFEAAVEANPGHRGANVALLLDLADHERWYELLNDARAFAHASSGHPYALLMSGMALHRIGWSEQALADFERALRRLPDAEVDRLRDPTPLMTPDQARRLAALEGEAAREAKGAFWASVDPVLTTEVNEREVEHLARAAYASLRFGGLENDPAGLWLRYGRPLRVRTLGEGSALRTEFWDYGGGPDATFRRPARSSDPALTPEARTYLDDLRKVFPQWYGNRARSVSALPAQVARFRGPAPGEVELQVHARVPETFGTGGTDSLEMALVVQDADGAVVSRDDLRIPARSIILRLPSIRAPGGAEQMVVELYHPGLSQAVGLRVPVTREGSGAQDPRVSDLLLTEPPRRGGEAPSRGSPELGARTLGDDATGDRLGVLFEVYDVAPEDTVRLRVTLESPGSAGRPLSARPWDAPGFVGEWSRSPGPEGRTTEHVALDLSGVPAGSYVLRLEARVGDGEPWVATRRIERR